MATDADRNPEETRADEDSDDAVPAEDAPLGSTPEVHDDLDPHDLPRDHPSRHAAEHAAEQRGDR